MSELEQYYETLYQLLAEEGFRVYEGRTKKWPSPNLFIGIPFWITPFPKKVVAEERYLVFTLSSLKVLDETYRPALERFVENYKKTFDREIELYPYKLKSNLQGELSIAESEGTVSLLENKIGRLSESE